MGDRDEFTRRWWVTPLRLAVVLAVIVVAALTFYVGSAAEMHRMQDPHSFTFWRAFGIVAVAPLLWLIPMGTAADHVVSEYGPFPALLLHLAGVHITAAMAFVGLGLAFARNFPPLGEPYATLGLWSIAVWVVIGFAAAGLVPGSFPPGGWPFASRRRATLTPTDTGSGPAQSPRHTWRRPPR